jgi:poly(3-hydroxybutyrate) depolymerase
MRVPLTLRSLCPAAVLAALLAAAPVAAQAPANLSVLRVRYSTLKATARPDGPLKARIDEIDAALVEATRLGRTGEVRRLLAKGSTLLNGRDWTELDEFGASLVLRADRVVVDPASPMAVRLEQIFAPGIALAAPLTVRAALRPLLSQPQGSADAWELGRFEGVSRDLRESPLAMELDVSAAPAGPHVLDVQVFDGPRTLSTASLRLWVQRGLDDRLRALEVAAREVPAAVKADVRYPGALVREVDRGLRELGTMDVGAAIAAAEEVVRAARGGADPFAGRKGDFERHYVLDGTTEILPYRVYVPSSYDGSTPVPIVVALHGLGSTEDAFFDSYQRRVPQLAEKYGYLVVAPLGYRIDGFYGWGAATATDPAVREVRERSERDVLQVLSRMRRDYRVDDRRIYLLGHSMGAIGAWSIAAKVPSLWAAVAAFAGTGAPATAAHFRDVPQYVVHGDADPTVPVSGSRNMVAGMKTLGMEVTYVEVPGGGHSDVVVPHLAAAFEFFDGKRRKAGRTAR